MRKDRTARLIGYPVMLLFIGFIGYQVLSVLVFEPFKTRRAKAAFFASDHVALRQACLQLMEQREERMTNRLLTKRASTNEPAWELNRILNGNPTLTYSKHDHTLDDSVPKILRDLNPSWILVNDRSMTFRFDTVARLSFRVFADPSQGQGTKEVIPGLWWNANWGKSEDNMTNMSLQRDGVPLRGPRP